MVIFAFEDMPLRAFFPNFVVVLPFKVIFLRFLAPLNAFLPTFFTFFPILEVPALKPEYKPLYEKFGLNVAYYRKLRKLTQAQLAELSGVDRSHISAIESGRVGVSFDVIFRFAEILRISPKDLFDFRD